ncbi:MAG TPA: hypothetical protein VMZ51_07955, partial [Acidimicrobiales bacterium]|nr:hypothetical protein [Acidimicrobiales bacterium]
MTTIYIASVSPANGGDYELGPEWHPTTLDGETLAEHAERHDLTILDDAPATHRGLIRNESAAECWFLAADGQLEAVRNTAAQHDVT